MPIAIIGFGPRGFAAAEFALQRHSNLEIDIFDPLPCSASGPNFLPDEAEQCLLNIPLHDVNLPMHAAALTASFKNWVAQGQRHAPEPDHYLPRNMLGTYLHERFLSLAQSYPGAIRRDGCAAVDAWSDSAGWWIATQTGQHGPYQSVVLTMGHPTTYPDDTMKTWQSFAAQRGFTIAEPYPGTELQAQAQAWVGKTVAIRGLGLSTLDVLSLLTLGQGGHLSDGCYQASGREPALILPFSLDGMPPMPKPVMAQESKFALTAPEHECLRKVLHHALTADAEVAMSRIRDELVAPVQRISGVKELELLQAAIAGLDADERAKTPTEELAQGIAMAEGQMKPTPSYALGQIWRALQDDLRSAFHQDIDNHATRAAILKFDRGLKRLTYGPPVSSARLLLALIEAGRVRLTVAEDPVIAMHQNGWLFDDTVFAQVMIDAVLPSAKLSQIADPLIKALWRRGILRENPFTGSILTSSRTGEVAPGLSVLGSLAEGSCIATDSIHDCFGLMTRCWAAECVNGNRRHVANDAHV